MPVQTRCFSNDLSELRRVSEWIRAYGREASVDDAFTYHIDLCLDEAVSNIIRHGYQDGSRGTITISLEKLDDGIRAVVTDGGPEFNPLRQPAPTVPTTLEDVRVGGLGIHLMRAFSDAFDYRREDGRNIITLDFRR
ncbi:MAG TPA: ATP-binding protein [Vicinamibacterales bacterium]|jgi:anti-sigma regulatory factor (Ser/Thr protein kinase)|nr:ATP-binding protein [Vicinamibacterales bacterium]